MNFGDERLASVDEADDVSEIGAAEEVTPYRVP
jgi:hypothetical protein